MTLLLGIATFISTMLGGLLALKIQDKLHLILGFSAGAVLGVAFFDLLPESIELGGPSFGNSTVTTFIMVGFLVFMFLSRLITVHPHAVEDDTADYHMGELEAGSLSIHSFLDGLGIGLAFQVSPEVGYVVAAAVLTHDFSDGINTIGFILRHNGNSKRALRWLFIDAIAPLVGIFSAQFIALTSAQLGLVLAVFCGFFLYIGASDLLPESQHHHPKLITSMMTIAGSLLIYTVIRLASL